MKFCIIYTYNIIFACIVSTFWKNQNQLYISIGHKGKQFIQYSMSYYMLQEVYCIN